MFALEYYKQQIVKKKSMDSLDCYFLTTRMLDLLFVMHVVSKCIYMYDYKLIKCVIVYFLLII